MSVDEHCDAYDSYHAYCYLLHLVQVLGALITD